MVRISSLARRRAISGPTPLTKRTGSLSEDIRAMLGGVVTACQTGLPLRAGAVRLGRSLDTQEDLFMARTCDICGKGVQHGQNVSHAHNVTKRRWEVNLQPVRSVVQGKPRKLRVCTRCIRSGAVTKGMRQKEAQRARSL